MWHEIAGTTGAVLLAAIGVLHLVWARNPWPARTSQDLARHVYGRGTELPPPAACVTVGIGLVIAAYCVLARAGIAPDAGLQPLFGVGIWLLIAVLLLRGLAGPLLSRGAEATFARLNVVVYSPLCVVLGLCAMAAATR